MDNHGLLCYLKKKKYKCDWLTTIFIPQFLNLPVFLILNRVAWQESLSFCRRMLLVGLLCGLFILCYVLYQREFLPGCPSMVHMQNREQQHLKNRQLSRSNARLRFPFVATPPPANTHFPIRGGEKTQRGDSGREWQRERQVFCFLSVLKRDHRNSWICL